MGCFLAMAEKCALAHSRLPAEKNDTTCDETPTENPAQLPEPGAGAGVRPGVHLCQTHEDGRRCGPAGLPREGRDLAALPHGW